MALHSIKELHDITADQIRELIKSGCKIDSNVPIHKQNVFYAKLVKEDSRVTGLKLEFVIATSESDDKFTKLFLVNNNASCDTIHRKCWTYFKAHDDIYADTEDEAKEEHDKFLSIKRKKLLDVISTMDTSDKDTGHMFSNIFGNLEFM